MDTLARALLAGSVVASVLGALLVCVLVARYGFGADRPLGGARVGHAAAAGCFGLAIVLAAVALSAAPATVPQRAGGLRDRLGALGWKLMTLETELARLGARVATSVAAPAPAAVESPTGASHPALPDRPQVSPRIRMNDGAPTSIVRPEVDAVRVAPAVKPAPVVARPRSEPGPTQPARPAPTPRRQPAANAERREPANRPDRPSALVAPRVAAPIQEPPAATAVPEPAPRPAPEPPPLPAKVDPRDVPGRPRRGPDLDDVAASAVTDVRPPDGPGRHGRDRDRLERLEAEPPERADGRGRAGRRDGLDAFDRPRFDRPDRERPAREERGRRPERGERVERLERVERPERQERLDRPERMERPERIERPERMERPERIGRVERIERADRSERVERPDRPDRGDRRGR